MILSMIRKKLDMSPGYIIEYIEAKYYIDIAYNTTWNARMKALTKIFEDWKASYETLSQYLDALKASNLGTVIVAYYNPYSLGMIQFLLCILESWTFD